MSEEVNKINPLIERINKIPGETIALPSRGMFYENGELDPEVVDGEIVLYPMTMIDEIMMRTPDMLFQGTAIYKVIGRCAPQILKPKDLLSGDVDYILTYLRKLSYGNKIPIKYKCEHCLEVAEDKSKVPAHEYHVPVDDFIRNTKEMDLTKVQSLKFQLKNGQNVWLKPITISKFIQMQNVKADDLIQDPEKYEDYISQSLSSVITRVDEVTDPTHIKEWVKRLPRMYIEELESKFPILNDWGPTFTYKIKCKDCKTQHELSTPINPVHFFMLPSSPTT